MDVVILVSILFRLAPVHHPQLVMNFSQYMRNLKITFVKVAKKWHLVSNFPVGLPNRLISAGFEPVIIVKTLENFP